MASIGLPAKHTFIFKVDHMYKVNSHRFLAHQSIGSHPSHSGRSQAALTGAVQTGKKTHVLSSMWPLTSVVTVRHSQLEKRTNFRVEWLK